MTLTTATRDTIEITDFALDRTHGMAGSTDIIFAFKRPEKDHGEWIEFNLREFGLSVGNHHFRFRRTDLEDIPE